MSELNTSPAPALDTSSFYVVAYESGAENPAIPTWANSSTNPLHLKASGFATEVSRVEVPEVPGTYQLFNVLSSDECDRLIQLTEQLGYQEDAAVSLPRSVRHNDNVVWVTDEATDDLIWQRVEQYANSKLDGFTNKRPVGINARFRFYRYGPGDFFKPHTDGAWPGSRVKEGELIVNAYPDRYSQMTFLIFLSDEFAGGETSFLVKDDEDPQGWQRVAVRTPRGAVLCFPHGAHPDHCVHGSEPVTHGIKYIIRTDMLFEL